MKGCSSSVGLLFLPDTCNSKTPVRHGSTVAFQAYFKHDWLGCSTTTTVVVVKVHALCSTWKGMIGRPAEKVYSKSSGPMVMVMLQWVTSLVCILQEKVGSGLTAIRQPTERVVVLALLNMNMVSIHVKSGTATMDQSSRCMLKEL